jgi:hypothetical protein
MAEVAIAVVVVFQSCTHDSSLILQHFLLSFPEHPQNLVDEEGNSMKKKLSTNKK